MDASEMNEIDAWKLHDDFEGRVLAALIMGVPPSEAAVLKIEPMLRKLRSQYNLALRAYRDILNPDPEDEKPMMSVPDEAIQSRAMKDLAKLEHPDHDALGFYQWLIHDGEAGREWTGGSFENQWFERSEVARWLTATGIASEFDFGVNAVNSGQSGRMAQTRNPSPAPEAAASADGGLADPERRLAQLRALGGSAIRKQCDWKFPGITALVAREKAEGRKRSDEKTIRKDLRKAAQAEQDAKRAGFADGLGQR